MHRGGRAPFARRLRCARRAPSREPLGQRVAPGPALGSRRRGRALAGWSRLSARPHPRSLGRAAVRASQGRRARRRQMRDRWRRRLVGRAIRLYEAHRASRPPGWPEGGAAALCVLADQARARSLAGDVARLLALAKAMRAVALEHDRDRLRRAQARAARRRRPAPARFAFRLAALAWRRRSSVGGASGTPCCSPAAIPPPGRTPSSRGSGSACPPSPR